MSRWRHLRLVGRSLSSSPESLVVGGFALVILVGSLLLLLPWARTGEDMDFVTALFTSTSAVCVTGLIVVDFPVYYSTFGQIIVLALIQVGGLGVMTGAAFIYRLLGRRLSLRSEAALHNSVFQRNAAAEFRLLFRRILLVTLVAELAGAIILAFGIVLSGAEGGSIFPALFQSVSAFNNAGFSTYSDSLIGFADQPLVLFTIMALIVLGGLGGIVLVELLECGRNLVRTRGRSGCHFGLHSRLVFIVSGVLILSGAGFLLATGTPTEAGAIEKVGEALFQSVTARTAGFNTVAIGALPVASLVLLIALMFVGGSPASTAGGIKTTTLAIWLADVWSAVRKREEVVILKRAIPPDVVRRALLLINLAVLWNFVGVLLLLVLEKETEFALLDLLFEQISAFATVGLSTGVTPELSTASRLWIIVTMFVGRLGPLLLASWAFRAQPARVHHATGRVLIG